MQANKVLTKADTGGLLRVVNYMPGKRKRIKHRARGRKNLRDNLSKTLKQRRVSAQITLDQLGAESGVPVLHLVRIEEGECHLSASVLRKVAKPLGISEIEVLTYPRYIDALNRLRGFKNRKR